jgi:carboxyl-terminal processing protease
MKSSYKYPVLPILFFFLPLAFFSCQDEVDDPMYVSRVVKESIYEGMLEWYYWNEEIPAAIDLHKYNTNEALLEDLRYKALDKWSYLTTVDAFDKAFTGQNAGHGVGFAIDQEDRVFLTFVYDESPAGKDGWERGWQIIEVNNKPISAYKVGNGYNLQLGADVPGVTNTFKFQRRDGSVVERTIPKAEYQSNSVLYQTVFEEGNNRIGYWAYNSFKASLQVQPTKSLEVENSMAYFEENQINELIIDLRYNGGGSVAVAEQIMNYLIPPSNDGELMYTNTFNQNKEDFNEETFFEKLGNLNLNRLIFITSRGSASSSELLINCLSPYIDVVLIGDNTYGKPVGAFPLSSFYKPLMENNVELVPITFAIANAEGKAAYYDGFPVDMAVADEPSKNWGDPEEARLQAALTFIKKGNFGERTQRRYHPPAWAMIDNFKGLQQEFPAY